MYCRYHSYHTHSLLCSSTQLLPSRIFYSFYCIPTRVPYCLQTFVYLSLRSCCLHCVVIISDLLSWAESEVSSPCLYRTPFLSLWSLEWDISLVCATSVSHRSRHVDVVFTRGGKIPTVIACTANTQLAPDLTLFISIVCLRDMIAVTQLRYRMIWLYFSLWLQYLWEWRIFRRVTLRT